MKKFGPLAAFTVLFVLVLAMAAAAQKSSPIAGPMIPFDFADNNYIANGVDPNGIISRLTGGDKLSVFEPSPSSQYSNVRVLITMPAYDQLGRMIFWLPLGNLQDSGFAPSQIGQNARQMAGQFPMYAFASPHAAGVDWINGLRQAPVIDTLGTSGSPINNPLSLRIVYLVSYTDKALNTDEGIAMMKYFGDKNGWAADNTAILKTVSDIRDVEKGGFVTVTLLAPSPSLSSTFGYTIAPVFTNPTNGAIRPDAFLWMTLKDGQPLAGEASFSLYFTCLRNTGGYCQPVPSGRPARK